MDKRLDLLNREEFIENVIKIVNQLSDIKRGCCFAIEGGWGVGKTFVIEEIEERLKVIQSEETNTDRYFVFHYNCWQHDYYEEPAVAIISAMIASIKDDEALLSKDMDNTIKAGYELAKEKFKEIAGLYIENKIGINLISLADKIEDKQDEVEAAEHEFDQMFNFSQTIEKVRKKLREIAEQRTIVLFVDELDRCIPQYAIKVLERLHHIFNDLDNVVVIMAIDRKQLEHSVEEMFGVRKDESSIDIEKYLKKFIDFSMVLDNGIMNELFIEKNKFYFDKFIFQEGDAEWINKLLLTFFKGIDIRRQEKIMDKINMVHSVVCNGQIDIAVSAFEIMYEIMKELGCSNMDFFVRINDIGFGGLEDMLGVERVQMIRLMEKKAWHYKYDNKKVLLPNIYGKIFWYFSHIFTEESNRYLLDDDYFFIIINSELEIVKKYCVFSGKIK